MPDGCPTCAGWPPRVVYVNEPEVQEAAGPTLPARCNRCGRVPLTIEVIYEDRLLDAAARMDCARGPGTARWNGVRFLVSVTCPW